MFSRKLVLGLGATTAALGSLAFYLTSNTSQATTELGQTPQIVAQGSLKSIKIAFASRSDSTDLQNKANRVAQLLSKEMGMPVEATIAAETAAVEALKTNRVQVAFVAGRGALKAEQLAKARMYLAEVRPNYSGRHTYRSVFVVAKNSPLKSGNSKQTLAQLRGKKVAFASPTSGSGFIFPTAELVKNNFVPNRDRLKDFFGSVFFGDGYSSALQQVLRGQADVAAVSEYAVAPPYVKADEVQKLRVLYSIPNVPAHGIVIDDSVPAATRDKLINAFLKLNQPANNKMLKDLYNSTELVKVDHNSHLAPIRDALKLAGFEP
ncbi:phosphate/phosphite/phosphonate ABC transporter substrate-binding protein [Pseudanabaena sp. PCC 6802]|uniref:phosphate/phosphite/phosphonate ABC transporter substrate-binding protein n=1 Tax=Pseudanabaena sp. PCC 6802 TaxID=118173 RepID=UPI000347E5B4|nr:phosphate/phosphite/phosphonate ABC transporter substrate-binding protein [Pseudanabaena sp. PCC 6802]